MTARVVTALSMTLLAVPAQSAGAASPARVTHATRVTKLLGVLGQELLHLFVEAKHARTKVLDLSLLYFEVLDQVFALVCELLVTLLLEGCQFAVHELD